MSQSKGRKMRRMFVFTHTWTIFLKKDNLKVTQFMCMHGLSFKTGTLKAGLSDCFLGGWGQRWQGDFSLGTLLYF